jgi:hypothetical protein
MVVLLTLLSGCTLKYKYQEPAITEPHAKVTAITDQEHTANVFGDSTICILGIDGKNTKSFWSGKYVSPLVAPGERTLYVEDDVRFSEFIYISQIKFIAKAGETYTVSSKHIYKDDNIVDMEFLLLNRGEILGIYKAEKVRRGNAVYVPIMI